MKTRPNGNAFHHVANHARLAACGNNGVNPGAARDISGLQFCSHPAGSQTRDAIPGNGAQRIINTVHIFNQLRLRVGAGIGGEQALLIGQQQQLIGASQNCRQRREVVVITNLNFGGCYRVILINDRNNVVIQQRAERIAGIEEALSVFHICTRQQHLPDVNTVNREKLFPQLNQSALPYCRQQLFRGYRCREFRVTKMLTSGGNCARGNDNNTMPCGMKLRALANQFYDVGAVQAADPPVNTLVPSFTTSVWLSLMILCHSKLGKMISNERFSRTSPGCQQPAHKA